MKKKGAGFSLIELMIALLLSAFVLMAVVGLFQQSKGNQVQNEQISRMQENGRYAVRLVAREIGMAGYWGGILDPSLINVSNASDGTDCNSDWMLGSSGSTLGSTASRAIEFENDATSSPYDCIDDADLLDGTDVLGIRRVADNPDRYRYGGTTTGALNVGTIYLKANGELGYMFNSTATGNAGPTEVTAPWEMRQYYPEVIFLAPDFTLRRMTLVTDDMTEQTLVDGIENLQVEFGIDGTDGDLAPDYYEPDPDAAELLDAVSVRIYVLVRSPDPIAGYVNDKTYNLGTTTVGPFNDDHYRRVYSTTAPLRNSTKLKMQAL